MRTRYLKNLDKVYLRRHWIITLYTMMKVEVLQGTIDLTIPLFQCIVTTIVVTIEGQP